MSIETWKTDGHVVERHEGAEAAQFAQHLLMEATGTNNIGSAKAMLLGRPTIEEQREKSSLIQFRVPESWKPQIEQDAASQGQSLSEYLRDLVAANHRDLKTA